MDASLADKCFRRIPCPSSYLPGGRNPGSTILTRTNRLNRAFNWGANCFTMDGLAKTAKSVVPPATNLSVPLLRTTMTTSHGVSNSLSTRNAPVLVNLAWMKAFHWDGGEPPGSAAVAPLTAPTEMGENWILCFGRSGKDTAYQRMFKAASLAMQRSAASAC